MIFRGSEPTRKRNNDRTQVRIFIFIQDIQLANRGDPDQTPRSVASNLGLHCLPVSHKKDDRHIWVKVSSSLFLSEMIVKLNDGKWG